MHSVPFISLMLKNLSGITLGARVDLTRHRESCLLQMTFPSSSCAFQLIPRGLESKELSTTTESDADGVQYYNGADEPSQ